MGWIFFIVIISLPVILVILYFNQFRDIREPYGEPRPEVKVESPHNYYKRNSVFNNSEKQLYLLLKQRLGEDYILLSKVRIEDFIDIDQTISSWADRQSFRGFIKSRHVDFLICDMATTKPLLAIELDGSSHFKLKRIERDNLVTDIYAEAKLPLKRIRVGSDFAVEVEEIKKLLNPSSIIASDREI